MIAIRKGFYLIFCSDLLGLFQYGFYLVFWLSTSLIAW